MDIIQIDDQTYEVLSDSGNLYKIRVTPVGARCTCTGFKYRQDCKHVKALQIPEKKRYPRICVDEVLTKLKPALQGEIIYLAGSYRRQKDMIGDVDILIQADTDSFMKVASSISALHTQGRIQQIICTGTEIIRGLVKTSYGDIQFDITRVNENELATYLLYRTGPKDLNIRMRSLAKMLGYKLNEHGLFDTDGHVIPTPTEASVFAELNMKYLTPAERS